MVSPASWDGLGADPGRWPSSGSSSRSAGGFGLGELEDRGGRERLGVRGDVEGVAAW